MGRNVWLVVLFRSPSRFGVWLHGFVGEADKGVGMDDGLSWCFCLFVDIVYSPFRNRRYHRFDALHVAAGEWVLGVDVGG